MKVLLDTHVWIWWVLGSERLSPPERRSLDQLPPSFHGDPADRLIVATALCHGLPLATHDSAIQASCVIPIWEGCA